MFLLALRRVASKGFLEHFWPLPLALHTRRALSVVTTPGSLLLIIGFGLAPKDRFFMGANKVIPILGSPMVEDCLLLMFEPSNRDDLSSCGGLNELPKWLLFESLMKIAGERGRG